MDKLERKWLVHSNPHAGLTSDAMAMPKCNSFRLAADYRTVDQQQEAVPWPHPNLEQSVEFFSGASYSANLDLLQGFWKMTIDEEGEDAFTMVTEEEHFPLDVLRNGYLMRPHTANPRWTGTCQMA